MAVTSNTFTISYSSEPGDGSYSISNRYAYSLKEKLLEHGFNMVYENSVPNIDSYAKEYILSLDGVSGVLLKGNVSRVYAYAGIINGNSIDPSIYSLYININNTGISTFNCFFSNNFYFLSHPHSYGTPLIIFFKTNYGWCPCASDKIFVNINGQYYIAYKTPVGNNPGYLNLDNNHVLYSPTFARQTVPGLGSNNADRRLDETIKYAGIAYQQQDTLTPLIYNTMYKINDTNETFYYWHSFGLIIFD